MMGDDQAMIRMSTPSDADAISEVLRAAFTPFKDGCTAGAFKAITPPADEIRGRYNEGRSGSRVGVIRSSEQFR